VVVIVTTEADDVVTGAAVVVVALGSVVGVELSFLGLSTGVDVSTSFRCTS